MRKIIAFLICLCTILGLSGCSSGKTAPAADLPGDLHFEMLDVVKITNETTNTVYYYYLASLTNNGEDSFHIADLHMELTDKRGEDLLPISSMDRDLSMIATDLDPGQGTFIYGFYGFPNGDYKTVGLSFGQGVFVSFDSVNVRTIKDQNIVNSNDASFVIYEDQFFEFEVDSSKVQYSYKNGVSVVSGLILTYKNKTDQRLVVPYLTPVCTIDGLELGDYPNPNALKAMSLEELKQQDFRTNGLAPKTKTYTGTALNYQLYYLEPKQEVPCQVTFTFKGIIPDFTGTSTSSGIVININSAPLGYSQRIQVSY